MEALSKPWAALQSFYWHGVSMSVLYLRIHKRGKVSPDPLGLESNPNERAKVLQ